MSYFRATDDEVSDKLALINEVEKSKVYDAIKTRLRILFDNHNESERYDALILDEIAGESDLVENLHKYFVAPHRSPFALTEFPERFQELLGDSDDEDEDQEEHEDEEEEEDDQGEDDEGSDENEMSMEIVDEIKTAEDFKEILAKRYSAFVRNVSEDIRQIEQELVGKRRQYQWPSSLDFAAMYNQDNIVFDSDDNPDCDGPVFYSF